MVSICGGEPLIYPKIEELVAGLLQQGRIVYLCTNGMFMRKKMRDYLASHLQPEPGTGARAPAGGKANHEKDAETIRKGKSDGRPVIRPTRWMYWNVHIDGLEYTHDLIVEREGVFKECVEAIKMAKILGYQVATNTTVYKETDVKEIEQMFEFFSSLEVDAHTISPGYEYDAAKKDMVKRLGKQPEDFFLTRKMTREKLPKSRKWGERFTIFGTPGLPGISGGQTGIDLHRLGHSHPQCPRLEGPLLPDDRRPLCRLPGDAGRKSIGTNTAWWTAWRAIRAAKIAWFIAVTIPAAP
jgi:MoaA/NifB/PqqE/SkfB family radical SAM enzyme